MHSFTSLLIYLGLVDYGQETLRPPAHGNILPQVTTPFPPLQGSPCNIPSDRSRWCDGFSIDTDDEEEGPTTGNVCEYDFVITNTTMEFDGTKRLALAVNGQVPGPTIECQWGDVLRVNVTNNMPNNQTAMHWHGLSQRGGQTNDQDGVPGVTECAIAPGHSRMYEFKLSEFGPLTPMPLQSRLDAPRLWKRNLLHSAIRILFW